MTAQDDEDDRVVLERVLRFAKRTEQRLTFRQHEGRKLSKAHVEALREIHRLLGMALDAVDGDSTKG